VMNSDSNIWVIW